LNSGSKVVLAAFGEKKRELCREVPSVLQSLKHFENPSVCMPGVIALQTAAFTDYTSAKSEMDMFNEQLKNQLKELEGVAILVIADDASFVSATMNNYLWVTYTRCNPSHDMYGIESFQENKHWGCKGPLVIDARIKKHHAPPVEKDPAVEKKIDRLFDKGGSLYGVLD
jgi:4-hydroxy-3-polyprenylbenzoate decarboxylase